MRALLPIVLLAGCTGEETYMIVTVDKRPAVHGAARLEVTLSNDGSMRTDALALGDNQFPATFSISAPGRSGELGISIDALDEQGALVGRGKSTTDLLSTNAAVMLDSA